MAITSYGRVRAPSFPAGLDWLNTPAPLALHDLRGKFVLLDFWTFCCINCMHILPDLQRLERKYAAELAVVGVHSAKFDHERGTEHIRNAVLRYRIEHPVVNDHAFQIWEQYAVRAWPTLYLIDPEGYIVGRLSGEGVFDPIDQALQELIPAFEKEGILDRTPLPSVLEREREPTRMLAYPGKVAADPASRRLFIADTNHHRVLVADFEGRVQDRIGSGAAGLTDGGFEEASFRHPQGLCLDPASGVLYVADTENHALRSIDLGTRRVTTLAGNGAQAPYGTESAQGAASPLNSPWDVLLHGRRLYVAMAGPHQLWTFDPGTGHGEVYAGNGRENIVDGPRLEAHLAQPSGLTDDGTYLYFADSETSALRRVPFPRPGGTGERVETLIGLGLFEFGDVDGCYPEARLQHPLGLAYQDGAVYIADTYNHKIRKYNIEDATLSTFLGTGRPGLADGVAGKAAFDEPGGLSAAGGKLFIADTNNHQIRIADLETGEAGTLTIAEHLKGTPREHPPAALPLQAVAPGTGTLRLHIALPDGYKPNGLNPGRVRVAAQDDDVARPASVEPRAPGSDFTLTFAEGETALHIEGTVYSCENSSGRCLLHPVALHIPLVVDPGQTRRHLDVTVAVGVTEHV